MATPPAGKFMSGSKRIVRGNCATAKRARRMWYAESESSGRTRSPAVACARVWSRRATPREIAAAIPRTNTAAFQRIRSIMRDPASRARIAYHSPKP